MSDKIPSDEESKRAMMRKKTKYAANMENFSSRKNAYKQGWRDCYEWTSNQLSEKEKEIGALRGFRDHLMSENERLKGLIEKAFNIDYYVDGDIEAGWEKFKTENNLI